MSQKTLKSKILTAMNTDLVLLYSSQFKSGALVTQHGYQRLIARMNYEDRETHIATLIDPITAAYLKAELIDI